MNNIKEQDNLIRSAQYRKGASICWFNATNCAISLLNDKLNPINDEKLIKELVIKYRDFFIESYKEYYKQVIENIGNNFNLKESLGKLKSVKNLEELRSCWVGFSADERQEKIIIEEKNKLKEKFDKL